jgi:peptidoglycan/xylan/chitin deacetylase (PgdA/CDA1 family)
MNDRARRPLAVCLLVALLAGACLPDAVAPSGPAGSGAQRPTASPSPSGPTPPPSFVRPTATPVPAFTTYVVVRGDSLTSIAGRFNTTARSIAYWNRTTYPSLDPESESYAPNRIDIGWVIVLIPNAVVDPQTLPELTPLPASQPPFGTPAPGETPPVTPAPGAGAIVVSHGWQDGHEVALTFDMGGRLDPALDIMGWLTDHGVQATIFPTGKSGTDTAIGREVVRIAAGRPDLFDIGNHSWDHPAFTDLDAAAIANQLETTESAIAGLTGATTKPWFRPPFGAWDDDVRKAVGSAGWAYLVMWDVDTIDWRPTSDGGPTALDIEAKVLSRVRGGSIVLMHLGGYNTLEALPAVVDGLRAKGLNPVTLTELLEP